LREELRNAVDLIIVTTEILQKVHAGTRIPRGGLAGTIHVGGNVRPSGFAALEV
jgi:hypothetical protein